MINKETGECTNTDKGIILALIDSPDLNMSQLGRKVGKDKAWIKRKTKSLNDLGILKIEDTGYEIKFKLNKDIIKTKFSTDKFLKSLYFIFIVSFFGILTGYFLFDYNFIFGIIFFAVFMFFKYLYKILVEKEEKMVFVKLVDADTPQK